MDDPKTTLLRLIAESIVADRWNPFPPKAFTPAELSSIPHRTSSWRPLYLLCMTARSGSTMLCSVLEQTGLVGRPDEYINPRGPFPMHYERIGKVDLRTYFHELWKQNAGPGGIFGIKTPFQDLSPFLQAGLVDEWFGSANFIYLSRSNIYEQAVSVEIARQSGLWHQRQGEPSSSAGTIPQYGPALRRTLKNLVQERSLWESFFALYEINPLRITYEDFASGATGLESTARRVLCFLGYDVSLDYCIPSPATVKLASDLNTLWADQLRSEARADPEIQLLTEWRDG